MSRDLTTEFSDKLEDRALRLCLLIKVELTAGDINLWTGYGDLEYNGDTYTGAGTMLGISDVRESKGIAPSSVTYSLSGIPSSLVALALTEGLTGQPITAFLGIVDDNDDIFVYQKTRGYIDVPSIEDNGGESNSVISITVEHDMIRLRNVNNRLYSSQDQKKYYPADTFFDYVASLQDKQITWGR